MNKSLATLGIGLLVTGCAYNPVIDTGGRSGTFNKSKADKSEDRCKYKGMRKLY